MIQMTDDEARKRGLKINPAFGPWTCGGGGTNVFRPVSPWKPFSAEEILALVTSMKGKLQVHFDEQPWFTAGQDPAEVLNGWPKVKKDLDARGVEVDMLAPRPWFQFKYSYGALTNPVAAVRKEAIEYFKRCIDACQILNCDLLLWLATEGHYCQVLINQRDQYLWLVEALDELLAYDPQRRIVIEPKPEDPVLSALVPTAGDVCALAHDTADPERIGVLIELAHSKLAGLAPSGDVARTMARGKLWGFHLNDQPKPSLDFDLQAGAANIVDLLGVVAVMEHNGYGQRGETILSDTKAAAGQPRELALVHLKQSLAIFSRAVDLYRSFDQKLFAALAAAGNHDGANAYVTLRTLGMSDAEAKAELTIAS